MAKQSSQLTIWEDWEGKAGKWQVRGKRRKRRIKGGQRKRWGKRAKLELVAT